MYTCSNIYCDLYTKDCDHISTGFSPSSRLLTQTHKKMDDDYLGKYLIEKFCKFCETLVITIWSPTITSSMQNLAISSVF